MSARARQLNHRLKNRKNAIISRREAEAPATEDYSVQSPKASSSSRLADMGQLSSQVNGGRRSSASPSSGFVAVNSKQAVSETIHDGYSHDPSRIANVTIVNGTSLHGASAATRNELLSKFFTNNERIASSDLESRRSSVPASRSTGASKSKSKASSENVDYANILLNSASPVPIPSTPSSLLPYVKPSPADRSDDSGPYKAEMVTRMEQLQRGERIQPPCDRCRRLHMDCLKNLTACLGCTKKHAKCSWKDVIDDELRENPYVPKTSQDEGADGASDREGYPKPSAEKITKREYPRDDRKGVRDEELLGEEGSEDDDDVDQRKSTPIQVATAGRLAPMMSTPPPSNTDADVGRESDGDKEAHTPGTLLLENRLCVQSVNGTGNGDTDADGNTDQDSEPLAESDSKPRKHHDKGSRSESTVEQLHSPALNGQDQSEILITPVYAPTAPMTISTSTR